MTIPLSSGEQAFNCCEVSQGLSRTRDKVYADEPETGKFIVWRVLGFGGRPNPLLGARAVSLAMRSAQCLGDAMCEETGMFKSQLYVDDPAITVAGSPTTGPKTRDVVLLWWLVLGLPLAWKKGMVYDKTEEHTWIGVTFRVLDDNTVAMGIPKSYLEDLVKLLKPLEQGVGSWPLEEARKVVGKAGRLAQIVPEARPFAGALWAAFSEAWKADTTGVREAPPGKAARSRFCYAAKWLLQLIKGDDNQIFPLQRLVSHLPLPVATTNDVILQFDASPWGREQH